MIGTVFNSNAFKVLSLLSISPGSRLGRKEIKEKTHLNNKPLDAALAKLVNSAILKREGRLYSLNFENEDAKRLVDIIGKEYRRLKEIPFDVYMVAVDLEHVLSGYKGIEAWLFGSYAKLVYRQGSDIDIAVLVEDELRKAIQKAVSKIEKSHGKKVETHFFDRKGFYSNKKDPIVADILKNGIRIV